MQRVRIHNSSADDNESSLGGTDGRTRHDPGARCFTTRMHARLMLPKLIWDMKSQTDQRPFAGADCSGSMRMPSCGEEVLDDRVDAVEQREADEEAILDALDVGQPSIGSTCLRTGGARRVSNTQSCAGILSRPPPN